MPILLPLLLAATPMTLTAAERPDAECLGAFAFMASKATGDQMTLARSGVFYYLGRLDTRHPGVDLEGAMRAVSPTIATSYDATIKRCTAEVVVIAGRLATAGEALQKP